MSSTLSPRYAANPRVGPTTSFLAQALIYSVAQLGAGFFYAFNNATLPLILNRYTQNPLLIGLLSSTRSIEGVVIQPLVGAWSDRTWSVLGRRRIFMAAGVCVSALFFLAAPFATSLVPLVVAIVLFSLTFNAAVDPYNALLADRFSVAVRSTVNGIAQLLQFIGQVAVIVGVAKLASAGHITEAFDVVGAVMLITFAITIAGVPEDRELAGAREEAVAGPQASRMERLRQYVRALSGNRMALRLLITLFFYNIGVNAILPYLTLYAKNVLHTDDTGATLLFLGLVLATGLLVVPAGLVCRRFGSKPVLLAGIVLMAVTAPAGLLVQNVPQTLVIVILAGIANSGITAAGWPLLTELIQSNEFGVFAGLKAAFESVAIPASVFVSSALIELQGYRSIFVVLTAGAAVAAVVLLSVRAPVQAQEAFVSER